MLSNLIRGLEDPMVSKLAAQVKSHVILNDAQTRSPILGCSTAMLNSIISNVALFAMTAIRRRAFRQRIGFRPYLNVVGFILEEEGVSSERSSPDFSYRYWLESLVDRRMGSDSSVKEVRGGRTKLRLVFDHNGDASTMSQDNEGDSGDGTSSALWSWLCKFSGKLSSSKYSFPDIHKRPLMDGTEVFQVYSISGNRPGHTVSSNSPIFRAHPVPVRSCREAYSVNEDILIESELSPLTATTADAVVADCGGSFSMQDFLVADKNDELSRSKQFSRVIVDIPCMDRPAQSGHGIRPTALHHPPSPKPHGRQPPSPKPHGPTKPTTSKQMFRVCIIVSDKQLLASLQGILLNLKIETDILKIKKDAFSTEKLKNSGILAIEYGAVFFDLDYIGIALGEIGFKGDRVFFTPNALLESSKHRSFDHILAIPCQQYAIHQLIVSHRSKVPSPLSHGAPLIKEAPASIFADVFQQAVLKFHQTQKSYAAFAQFIRTLSRLRNVLTTIWHGILAFVYWLLIDSKWSCAGQRDHSCCAMTQASFDSVYSTSIANSKSGGQGVEELPNFGSQFSFKSSNLAIPTFSPEIESTL